MSTQDADRKIAVKFAREKISIARKDNDYILKSNKVFSSNKPVP